MSSSSRDPAENPRIESWKEIAAFFGRDERTVRRWEKTRNLPVHRLPGEKGGVFAYTLELRAWLNSARPEPAASDPQAAQDDIPAIADPEPPALFPTESAAASTPQPPPRGKILPWLAGAAFLAAVAAIALVPAIRRDFRRVSGRPVTEPGSGSESPAHELCLKGRYYWTHRTDGSMKQAVDAFAQAVVRDPQYAPAYAGLADSYNLMPEYGSMPRAQAFPLAIAAARRAVALDGSLSEAHRSLGFALFYWQWDVNDAFAEFERAIRLDPKNVEAHSWYATSLLLVGRLPAARAQIAEARELNPASRAILADEAIIRNSSGDRAGALAELKELEDAEPDYVAPPRYLAEISFADGNYPAYIEALKRAAAISKDPEEAALAAAAEQGWKKGGERALLEALRLFYRGQFNRGVSSGFDEAKICAMLGRKAEADHYLQAAFDSRDFLVMSTLGGSINALMRGDPQFEKLQTQIRERMNQSSPKAPGHEG